MSLRVTHAVVAIALAAVAVAPARAQVIRPPNIQGPINAAKKVAGQTSDQINNAQKVGNSGEVKSGPTAVQQARAADQAKVSGPNAPQRGGAAPAKGQPAANQKAAGRGTSRDSGTVTQTGARRNLVNVQREVFSYSDEGRRDPFVSLMLSGELRPVFSDLVLTGVVYDERGRSSIAMLVDVSTGANYRVRVGQTLARMTVMKIGREDITFSIDEFGLSRTEVLVVDRTRVAGPARRP